MTSTTGRNSSEAKAGCTLLELVLVMLIVCTALALAAPSLRNFSQGSRNRDEALRILALTRWARSQAAATAKVHAIRFDPAGGTYRAEMATGALREPILTEFGRTFILPEDCQIQVNVTPGGEQNVIHFYPNGRTDGIRIFLRGPGPDEIDVFAPSMTEDYQLLGDEEREGR